MGLISSALGSISGTLAEQWKEYFSVDLGQSDFMKRGHRIVNGRASNNGNDNIISNGSKIIVKEGQGIIITDNGKIVDFSTTPGAFEFNNSSQPSLFYDKNVGENVKKSLLEAWERFKYGGQPSNEQRVYFFKTNLIQAIPFGTPGPQQMTLKAYDGDPVGTSVSITFHGKLDLKIVNPMLFYKEIAANMESYDKDTFINANRERTVQSIIGTMKSLATGGQITAMMIEDGESIGKLVDQRLSDEWINLYGIDIMSVVLQGINIPEKEKALITKAQEVARYGVQGQAMLNASNRDGNMMGAMMGVGFGQQMMGNQGMMGAGMVAQQGQGIKCPQCGTINNGGKFCSNCGASLVPNTWKCECGTENTGKFCQNCGKQKP